MPFNNYVMCKCASLLVQFIKYGLRSSFWGYCFSKHVNSKVEKPPSQLSFLLLTIIIMITSNEPWNTEKHTTNQNPPITDHKPWPFKPVSVKFCFLRGPLRWLTTVKNTIVKAAFELQSLHVFEKRSNQKLEQIKCTVNSESLSELINNVGNNNDDEEDNTNDIRMMITIITTIQCILKLTYVYQLTN